MTSGLLDASRRSLPLLVIAAVLPAGLVLVSAGSTAPTYTSTASVYVATAAGGDTRALDAGGVYVQRQMSSYAVLAESSEVLDPVIADLGTGQSAVSLARRLTVTATSPGHLIDVSSSASSADAGTSLVTAVARSLADQVVASSPRDSRGRPTVAADVLGSSMSRVEPQRPWKLAILAALVGLALAASVVLYRYAAVDRIRTIDEIGEITTAKVLARFGADRRRSPRADHPSDAHEMERLAVAVRNATDGGALLLAQTTPADDTVRTAHGIADELSTTGFECGIVQPAPPWGWLVHDAANTIGLPTPADVHAYVDDQRAAGHFTAIVRPPSRSGANAFPRLGATHGIVMVTLGSTSSASLVSALRFLEEDRIDVVGLVVSPPPRPWSRLRGLRSAPAIPDPSRTSRAHPMTERNGEQQCRS